MIRATGVPGFEMQQGAFDTISDYDFHQRTHSKSEYSEEQSKYLHHDQKNGNPWYAAVYDPEKTYKGKSKVPSKKPAYMEEQHKSDAQNAWKIVAGPGFDLIKGFGKLF